MHILSKQKVVDELSKLEPHYQPLTNLARSISLQDYQGQISEAEIRLCDNRVYLQAIVWTHEQGYCRRRLAELV